MAGFDNDVMFSSNVDFSGGSPVTGKVTTNGQLLIGSTAAPNIRVGTLTSTNGTLTITTGAGTLNADVSGTNTALPCFQAAVHGAGLSNVTGDGTAYIVIFDNINYDQASNYNNATGIFTTPTTGKYLFTVSLDLTGITPSHTSSSMSIQVGATPFFFLDNPAIVASPSGAYTIRGSKIIACAATDQVTVRITVSGGTKTIGIRAESFGEYSTFDGVKVA